MVGAKGFEPSTSWSRTRFRALWKSTEFCGSQLIDDEGVGASVLKAIETLCSWRQAQPQNCLHPVRMRFRFRVSPLSLRLHYAGDPSKCIRNGGAAWLRSRNSAQAYL